MDANPRTPAAAKAVRYRMKTEGFEAVQLSEGVKHNLPDSVTMLMKPGDWAWKDTDGHWHACAEKDFAETCEPMPPNERDVAEFVAALREAKQLILPLCGEGTGYSERCEATVEFIDAALARHVPGREAKA